jgi:hypothetical protein
MLRPRRELGLIDTLGDMGVIGRRGNRQHLADRLEPYPGGIIPKDGADYA